MEYLCSIWTNPDGSLNFGLKSMDELKAQKNSIKGSNPKTIGEVIKEIWK
ncbi:hypothetical protein [Zunongwangia sp. HGR-M22]|nr:hypothetical protein [Zunongwangia sp. HGR-M22]WBL24517.1 hypothetical protein PBT91_11435 [Zunongwangia sp. HGR-M22]